jgi:hypothetical protein
MPPELRLQVASGAFVSKDRDGALKRMVYLAASRYSPEQDDPGLFEEHGGAGDSANGSVPARPTSSTLRKISLTSVSDVVLVGTASSNSHLKAIRVVKYCYGTVAWYLLRRTVNSRGCACGMQVNYCLLTTKLYTPVAAAADQCARVRAA